MKIRISFNDKWICLHTWEAEWTKTNLGVFNTQNSYILKTVHIKLKIGIKYRELGLENFILKITKMIKKKPQPWKSIDASKPTVVLRFLLKRFNIRLCFR